MIKFSNNPNSTHTPTSEVYQFAEAEEMRQKRLRYNHQQEGSSSNNNNLQQQHHQQRSQGQGQEEPPVGLLAFVGLSPASSSSSWAASRSVGWTQLAWLVPLNCIIWPRLRADFRRP